MRESAPNLSQNHIQKETFLTRLYVSNFGSGQSYRYLRSFEKEAIETPRFFLFSLLFHPRLNFISARLTFLQVWPRIRLKIAYLIGFVPQMVRWICPYCIELLIPSNTTPSGCYLLSILFSFGRLSDE